MIQSAYWSIQFLNDIYLDKADGPWKIKQVFAIISVTICQVSIYKNLDEFCYDFMHNTHNARSCKRLTFSCIINCHFSSKHGLAEMESIHCWFGQSVFEIYLSLPLQSSHVCFTGESMWTKLVKVCRPFSLNFSFLFPLPNHFLI